MHFQISWADQRRETFGGLVEDEEPGIGRQGAADREQSAVARPTAWTTGCADRSPSRGNSA